MSVALRSLLFTLVFPGTLTVALPYIFLHTFALPRIAPPAVHWLGLLPLALGLGVYASCALAFASLGQGTPASWDPPRQLVEGRLYRWTRNPMYVGLLLILGGEALFWYSPTLAIYTALIWVAFHLRVVGYEEPTLRRQFGDSYAHYYAEVPRWLPRLRLVKPRVGGSA